MPTTLEIGRVVLNVANLEQVLMFYQKDLGLRLIRQSNRQALLGASNDDRVLLELNEIDSGVRSSGGTGLFHFAILVPTRKDLAQVLKHFARNRTPLQGMSDHFVSEALYLADPEGNGIEIYRDRPRSEWEWSEDGELNIGTVALDFEDLLTADDNPSGQWHGMPSGTTMGHVHLHVSNIPVAEAFYRDMLGFDIMMRYGGTASFVARDGYHHHLGLNTWRRGTPSQISEKTLGLRWFELKVHNLEETLAKLRDGGYAVEEAEDGFLIHDPVKNGILLKQL